METKLYVGNLADTTTEADLRQLFTQAGEVASVTFITDHQLGQSKGFAYVVMESPAAAQTAIDMFNAHPIADREMNVKLARTRQAPTGDASRLSAYAFTDRKASPRPPKGAPTGYQSRLGAFGSGKPVSTPRRRGNQRDNS